MEQAYFKISGGKKSLLTKILHETTFACLNKYGWKQTYFHISGGKKSLLAKISDDSIFNCFYKFAIGMNIVGGIIRYSATVQD